MAQRMATLVNRHEKYPEIPATAAERRRQELLKVLGRSFQELMESRQNDCALKGGTAMAFAMGLPRPSGDLDFEGNGPIPVRRSVRLAIESGFPDAQYRVGWDWLVHGSLSLTIRDPESGEWTRIAIDYRKAGSMPSIPRQVPLEHCRRIHGMNMYDPPHLAERKLQTVIGQRPRQKPRDLYDTGWLVHEHPSLITTRDGRKLKDWIDSVSTERRETLKDDMRRDRTIGRCNVSTAWRLLETGIAGLGRTKER